MLPVFMILIIMHGRSVLLESKLNNYFIMRNLLIQIFLLYNTPGAFDLIILSFYHGACLIIASKKGTILWSIYIEAISWICIIMQHQNSIMLLLAATNYLLILMIFVADFTKSYLQSLVKSYFFLICTIFIVSMFYFQEKIWIIVWHICQVISVASLYDDMDKSEFSKFVFWCEPLNLFPQINCCGLAFKTNFSLLTDVLMSYQSKNYFVSDKKTKKKHFEFFYDGKKICVRREACLLFKRSRFNDKIKRLEENNLDRRTYGNRWLSIPHVRDIFTFKIYCLIKKLVTDDILKEISNVYVSLIRYQVTSIYRHLYKNIDEVF